MGLLYRIRDFLKKLLRILLYPLVAFSKRLILPGFKGIPLYNVIRFFIRGLRKSSINIRAAAVSFSFILAAIPAVLFFFSLIPYIPIEGIHELIIQSLSSIMPETAFAAIRSTIEDIVLNHRTGLLSFGFLASIYFFSNGIMSLMNAFNQTSHTLETRPALYRRLVSLLLVMILSVLVIVASGTLIGTRVFIDFLAGQEIIHGDFSMFLIRTGEVILLLIVILFAYSSIYYLAPAKRGTIHFFSPGSVIGAVLSLITLQVFSYFIDNFGQQNKLYGSLGTLMVILIWTNLNTLVILIGFELNASIYDARRAQKELLDDDDWM
jgi:membrane protein